MSKQVIVKIKGKGQITLPAELREKWGLSENDELILIIRENDCILKPRRKVSVRDIAGVLGPGDKDEVEFAIMDPEFIPEYYKKKYGETDR